MEKEKVINLTNKPNPIIGGTKVYQKPRKVPKTDYWYCKIQEAEFMYLDFSNLTKNDLLFDSNGKERKFKTLKQKKLKNAIFDALKSKPDNGFAWIQVCEPYLHNDGTIEFDPKRKITGGIKTFEWENVASNYLPENGSQLATATIYYLLLLRWLKDGWVTLEDLADNSSRIGKYRTSKHPKDEFAGLKHFAGSTYKIIKDPASKSGFSLMGGSYRDSGDVCPVASAYHVNHADDTYMSTVGLIILTR